MRFIGKASLLMEGITGWSTAQHVVQATLRKFKTRSVIQMQESMKAMHEMLDFWALDPAEICHDCGTIWFGDRRTKRKFCMTVDICDEQSTNKIGDVFEFAARVF